MLPPELRRIRKLSERPGRPRVARSRIGELLGWGSPDIHHYRLAFTSSFVTRPAKHVRADSMSDNFRVLPPLSHDPFVDQVN